MGKPFAKRQNFGYIFWYKISKGQNDNEVEQVVGSLMSNQNKTKYLGVS